MKGDKNRVLTAREAEELAWMLRKVATALTRGAQRVTAPDRTFNAFTIPITRYSAPWGAVRVINSRRGETST